MSTGELNPRLGKRRWELHDEDEEQEAILVVNKWICGSQEVLEEKMNEVVVANLNWP